jgi:hypothetical protein
MNAMPVSVKYLFETEGTCTICGSKLMQSPKTDCTVVRRLGLKGAIVPGYSRLFFISCDRFGHMWVDSSIARHLRKS